MCIIDAHLNFEWYMYMHTTIYGLIKERKQEKKRRKRQIKEKKRRKNNEGKQAYQ